jgi:dTDP-4-dehydrorhamnose reductase
MFRVLSEVHGQAVFGTLRDPAVRRLFIPRLGTQLLVVEDLEDPVNLLALLDSVRPHVVVNCTALSRESWSDFARMISVFSVFPHRLAHLCGQRGARLIHISSDGVFRGTTGGYTERDLPDANDVYGISKLLGEVSKPNVVTLRTSIIGHALRSKTSLLDWFLSQRGECYGHTRAIFSGYPTVVLSQIVRDVILPLPNIHGIYHVATRPISKFDLLQLVARRYVTEARLIPDDRVAINRSLCADKFNLTTGYSPADWPALVDVMYTHKFGLEDN